MYLRKLLNILLSILVIVSLILIGIMIFIGVSMGKRADKKFSKTELVHNSKILDSILKNEKLDTVSTYKPLSLNFYGKPIFAIGQRLNEIDSTLSYRIDPNLDYQDFFPIVKDYITTEDKLSFYKIGENSYINGIIYFSADQHSQRIFNVSGTWSFKVYDDDVVDEMKNWLTQNLFPILKNNFEFKDRWNYKIETQNQVENFMLKGKKDNWILDYTVKLK